MEATIKLEKRDGSFVRLKISEAGGKRIKELSQELKSSEIVRLKEMLLLNQLKHSLKKKGFENDPFNDNALIKRESARYFKYSDKKVRVDTDAKGDFSLYVKTNMFGGTRKHLSLSEYTKA